MFQKKQIAHLLRLTALSLVVVCVAAWNNFNPFISKGKIPKRDRIDLALQQEYNLTRDPKTLTVPRERLYTAYLYAQSLRNNPQRVSAALVGMNWVERGPNNVSGRTRTMIVSALDPTGQTVFTAGVGGGVWKTTNISAASPTWTPVNDFFTNIAVTTIAQDPSNPNRIFFGTGEGWLNLDAIRGDGIWMSTDGGNTFAQMAGTAANANFSFINKIVVHPSSGDVFAATNGGLFRYNGTAWSKVLGNGVGAATDIIADIEIAANNSLVASTGRIFSVADGVYRSPLGISGTWTKLNLGTNGFPTTGFERLEIACAPSNASVIYCMAMSSASRGLLNIYKTVDAGLTWTTCALPVDADPGIGNDMTRTQAWYDLSIGVDPSNANTLIVGGIDLFKSTNGGTSWTQLTHWYGGFSFQNVHADQHAVVYRNSNEVYFTNDGGIYRSTNGGTTITFAGTNYNVTQYYACAINPTYGSNQYLAGAQDNGTQQYSVTGMNSTVEVTGGDGAFCHIDQLNQNLQFTAYVYNNIYRSTNGGGTFTSIRTDNNGSFINPSDFDNVNKNFYAGYTNGMYTRLLNAGTSTTFSNVTITAFNSGSVTTVACSPVTAHRVFFGLGNGRVVRVDGANGATPTGVMINGGSSGFPVSATSPVSISCIAIENDDDNHLLVTISNYGTTSVFETKNGGVSWTNVEGNIPDMPVRWALFNPIDSSSALVATELGVWTTDKLNGASTVWGPSNSGLANVRTDMLQVRASDNIIIAATHGRGLYSTDYFSPPYADFSADKLVTYTNKPIQFTDGSVKSTSWSWNFGDATTSNVRNPLKSYASPGVYTVTLQINNNSSLSKTRTAYITVLPNRGTPYSLAVGGNFDLNPNDFAGTSRGGTIWQRGSSLVTGKNGTRSGSSAWVTNLLGNYADNSEAILYSPNYSFTAAGVYRIKFYRKNRFETSYDGYRVEYSLNKGDSWTPLGTAASAWYDFTNVAGSSFPAGQPYFNADINTSFVLAERDISFLAGNANVAFRFVFRSDESVNTAGVAIDDFLIEGPNNTPLPVTLGSFEGTRNGDDNLLRWNTYSESNNKGFFVERSLNGFDFVDLAFVNGAGTTSIAQQYNYNDRNLSGSVYYYRLRQVDFNGDYAYSKTIALLGNNNNDNWVRIFPVPVRNTLNLLFTDLPQEKVVVSIFNAGGALMYKNQLTISGAGVSIPLDEYGFKSGMYFLAVDYNGRRFTEKFLKY
jgi:PKD repeat protein